MDLDVISETKKEIESTERSIAERQLQIEEVRADFWRMHSGLSS